jgi:hypothetical protein
MKNLRIALMATSVLLLLLDSRAYAQDDVQTSELHIYDRPTQAGTVADRVFKDSKGRVVKTVIYTGGGPAPYREELLRVYLITIAKYGPDDCVVRAATYWPGMILKSMIEGTCWPGTATPKLTVIRDAHGVRTQETRHKTQGGKSSVLLFDATGEKVIAIKSQTPDDVDLVHGWGKEVGGLACGIAANRERGRQEDLELFVTVKNISFRQDRVTTVSPVAVELKDSAGLLIGPKAEFASKEAKIAPSTCPPFGEAPIVGESRLLTSYRLGERYVGLAPGKYEMTVRLCSRLISGLLVSNTLLLEIEATR